MESLSNLTLFKQLHYKYDVIVIGGGCAGLEAAQRLYTNGIKNILVLEAQERLGGRINTIFLDDDTSMPIEIGANWIHGICVSVYICLFEIAFKTLYSILSSFFLINTHRNNYDRLKFLFKI